MDLATTDIRTSISTLAPPLFFYPTPNRHHDARLFFILYDVWKLRAPAEGKPGASPASVVSESGNVSLASSVGSDDGFVLAGKRRERRGSASGSPPVHRLCAYVSKPGGCRSGDACRFSHAT